MKTIAVVSDTHSNRAAIEKLYGIFGEADMIIHLGDTSSDGALIRARFHDKTRLINGNCDFRQFGVDESVIEVEGVKIFACHGHKYSVKSTHARLLDRAKELGCTLALYGHTHCAREEVLDGVTLFNPGTLSAYSGKSYGYIVISGGKAVTKIVNID